MKNLTNILVLIAAGLLSGCRDDENAIARMEAKDTISVQTAPIKEPYVYLPFSDSSNLKPESVRHEIFTALDSLESYLRANKIDVKQVSDTNGNSAEVYFQNGHLLKIEYHNNWANNGYSEYYFDSKGRIRYRQDNASGSNWSNIYHTYFAADSSLYIFNSGHEGEQGTDFSDAPLSEKVKNKEPESVFYNPAEEIAMCRRLLQIAMSDKHSTDGKEYYKGEIGLNSKVIIELNYIHKDSIQGRYRTKEDSSDHYLSGYKLSERFRLFEKSNGGKLIATFQGRYISKELVRGSFVKNDKYKMDKSLYLTRMGNYTFEEKK